MSVLGVSDMISSNLLNELDLNPVWEKWRGYFLAGSIVCSLIPFYNTSNGIKIHCVPKQTDENIQLFRGIDLGNFSSYGIQCCDCDNISYFVNNDCSRVVTHELYVRTINSITRENSRCNEKLTSPETSYINARCASQDNLFLLRHSGAIMLGMVVVIIAVSSFWLHIENVKDDIRRFADAIHSLPKVHMSLAEMKKICARTSVDSDDASVELNTADRNEIKSRQLKAVRGCIRVLTSDESTQKLFTWYLCRCIGLTCVIWCLAAIFVYVTVKFGHWKNDLTCKPTLNMTEYVKSYEEFHCTVNSANSMFVFNITFCVTLILQTLVFILPRFKWKSVSKGEFRKYNRSIRLLLMFWNSSIPTNSTLFRDIAHYIQTPEYDKQLTKNMSTICQHKDYELVRFKASLSEIAPEVLFEVYEVFTKDPTSSNLNMFIETMKVGRILPLSKESEIHVKKFIEGIKTKKLMSNELMVKLLHSCGNERIHEIAKIIDLNQIEDISLDSEERRSILFYAFPPEYKLIQFAVVKALCENESISQLKIMKKPSETNAKSDNPCEEPLEKFLSEKYTAEEVKSIKNECKLENRYVTSPA